MSRGLDVSGIDLVVNYDMPSYVSTYLHRVGRTARATNLGTAATIVAPNQVSLSHDLPSPLPSSCKKRAYMMWHRKTG